MTRADFIKKYTGMVIRATEGTGLFPSVMMAQAILESSDSQGNPGNSTLARPPYNNFFGIKAGSSWKGKTVNLATREVLSGRSTVIKDNFRVYDSPQQSFTDRVNFLRQNRRYKNVFTAPTPAAQADALQAAGYATDPNYASSLKSLIGRLQLERIDQKKK